MPAVKSSAIDRIDYLPGSRQMHVTFAGRAEPHVFHNVPQGVYREFLHAKSKGQHYAKHIKGKYLP